MNSPAAIQPPAPVQALVEDIIDPHPDIRIIRVRVAGPGLTWLAGQFMEISFKGFPPRSYSIASAPHEDLLEFHIRNNHRSGANQHAVTVLKTGDALTLRGPFGKATLSPGDVAGQTPLVLVAGGMGISPIKAIIDDMLHHAHAGPMALYWGGKTAADLYIADRFHDLASKNPAFHYIPVIEDQGAGFVTEATVKNENDFTGKLVYLSGPPGMIDAILPALLQHGAAAGHIRGDDIKIAALHAGPGLSP